MTNDDNNNNKNNNDDKKDYEIKHVTDYDSLNPRYKEYIDRETYYYNAKVITEENKQKAQEEYDRIIKILKRKRKEKDMSQSEVALMCDVSFNGISAMERGLYNSSATVLLAYMRAVGLSFSDIEPNNNRNNEKEKDKNLQRIEEIYMKLDDKDRTKLISIIETMFGE